MAGSISNRSVRRARWINPATTRALPDRAKQATSVLEPKRRSSPPRAAARVVPDDFVGDSTLLTAEHLFPWHFEDHPELAPYAEVAGVLAEHEWPRLYDAEVRASVDPGGVFRSDLSERLGLT